MNFVDEFLLHFGIPPEEIAGGVPALSQLLAVHGEPGTAFFNEIVINGGVENGAFPADAFGVENIKFRFSKGGGHFIFDDFDSGAAADGGAGGFFDGGDTADIHAHRGVEFEGTSPRGGFGAAEHDADFFADLVGEDHAGSGAIDVGGQFAEGLGHQAGLQAHVALAHFAFQLGFGCEGGDGVDDDDIEFAGFDQGFTDIEGFLPGIGLGDEEAFEVDPDAGGIPGVEGVFGIDKRTGTAFFLGAGDDVEHEGGFPGGLGAIDFDDASAGHPAHAEGKVQGKGTGGNARDLPVLLFLFAQLHDGALAKLFGDLGDDAVEIAAFGVVFFGFGCHGYAPEGCRFRSVFVYSTGKWVCKSGLPPFFDFI